MRAYLANKMTGKPKCNFPWFFDAAADLRARGIDVVSPAELDDPETRAAALASEDCSGSYNSGETWGDFLARDVKLIADGGIQAVIVGPEWHQSKGARLETFVAFQLGLPILTFPDLIPIPRALLAKVWAGYTPRELSARPLRLTNEVRERGGRKSRRREARVWA